MIHQDVLLLGVTDLALCWSMVFCLDPALNLTQCRQLNALVEATGFAYRGFYAHW